MDDGDLLAEILLRLPPLPSSLPPPRLPRLHPLAPRRHRPPIPAPLPRPPPPQPPARRRLRREVGRSHLHPNPGPDRSDHLPMPLSRAVPKRSPVLRGMPPRSPPLRQQQAPRGRRVGLRRRGPTLRGLPSGVGDDALMAVRNAAVLRRCAGGHFKVVLVQTDDMRNDHDSHACASVYDSKVGAWRNLVSTSIRGRLSFVLPSIMAGSSLYLMLLDYVKSGILEYGLDSNRLAVIEHPVDASLAECEYYSFQVFQTEDNRLGLANLLVGSTTIQIFVGSNLSGSISFGYPFLKSLGGSIFLIPKYVP